MTNNSKAPNPAISQTGAVELNEAELDKASGGNISEANALWLVRAPKIGTATQKIADGSVKPFMIDFKWEA